MRNQYITSIATFNVNGSGLIKVILVRMFSNAFGEGPSFSARTLMRDRIKFMNSTVKNNNVSSNFIRDRSEIFFFRRVYQGLFSVYVRSRARRKLFTFSIFGRLLLIREWVILSLMTLLWFTFFRAFHILNRSRLISTVLSVTIRR